MSKKPGWMRKKKLVKVVNIEKPGQDIYVSCQGEPYLIKDGSEIELPELVIESIKDAIAIDWIIEGEMGKTKSKKKVERARYMVVDIEKKPKEKETKNSDKKAA